MLCAALLVSACHDSTGLHVVARMGTLNYDALALEVARSPSASGAAPQILVDPTTNGRYPGPFHGGDQDVYVYLPDDLDGARLQCTLTALRAASPVGEGTAGVTVHRQSIEDVQIQMGSPGAPEGSGGGGPAVGGAGGSRPATGGAGGMAAGTGGAAGASTGGTPATGGTPGTGGTATGGTPGTGGVIGTGGAPPPATGGTTGGQKSSNGTSCNTATECASGHCVDGVCCESDCTGACTSCAMPGSTGLCRPAAGGLPDPRGICADMGAATCGTTGLCDVSGHCAKYPAGVPCSAPSCKNAGMAKAASTCDGAGSCREGATTKCDGTCLAGVCL